MELYSTPASPFARKVRVLVQETGQDQAIKITDVTISPINTNGDLVRHNPAGKVPTLVTDDGQALLDSRVICEYLDSRHLGEKMFPEDGAARWRAITAQALGDAIMDAGVLIRYEQANRPEEFLWQEWQQAQAGKALRIVASLEDQAEEFGGKMDIGMIAVGCTLSYLDFRFPETIAWRDGHPGLFDWYERFVERPSMLATTLFDPNEATR